MRIEAIEIDDHVLDKIESKHGIGESEAREACLSEERHVRRGKEGIYIVFSRTNAGRYILVALADRGGGYFQVATAREMTLAERRLYKRATGG
jgi:uncharacterized DUF497 family protein